MFLHSEGTQRGSQSYMEKRRGRRELEVTQMRWGGINRGESKLASNHLLMCTPQLDRSEMITELYREEKREEGDRGDQEDKRREWKGERQIQAVSNPERWYCESAALNMPAHLENSAVATGLEKVSFHSNPKERQCQRMLKLLHNYTHLTC